jgi:hypothetical protein
MISLLHVRVYDLTTTSYAKSNRRRSNIYSSTLSPRLPSTPRWSKAPTQTTEQVRSDSWSSTPTLWPSKVFPHPPASPSSSTSRSTSASPASKPLVGSPRRRRWRSPIPLTWERWSTTPLIGHKVRGCNAIVELLMRSSWRPARRGSVVMIEPRVQRRGRWGSSRDGYGGDLSCFGEDPVVRQLGQVLVVVVCPVDVVSFWSLRRRR